MQTPTQEELWNEELELVEHDASDSWRHGCNITEVYKRESDSTYWQVEYQKSTDGETNGLREGNYTINRVYPKQVTTTVYSTKEE